MMEAAVFGPIRIDLYDTIQRYNELTIMKTCMRYRHSHGASDALNLATFVCNAKNSRLHMSCYDNALSSLPRF